MDPPTSSSPSVKMLPAAEVKLDGVAVDLEAGTEDAVPALNLKLAEVKTPPAAAAKPGDVAIDLEAGTEGASRALYPKMAEEPRLRWAFIRKVYAILAVQFTFTAAVAAVACFVRPIPAFVLSNTPPSWTVFVVIILSPLAVMWPMMRYRERHPLNLVFLALFTLCISLSVGISSATFGGAAVLQAAILTAVAVICLMLFTFWASRRGCDFTFLFPFLFISTIVLLVYLGIQLYFPLGRVGLTIYGFAATVVFSGFIIHDTNQLIKRHTYNKYVDAAISLYLDVVNIFMAQLAFTGVIH